MPRSYSAGAPASTAAGFLRQSCGIGADSLAAVLLPGHGLLHGPVGGQTRPLTCGQASAGAGLPPGAPIGVCPVVCAFAGPRRVSGTSTPLGRGYKRPLRRWLSSVWDQTAESGDSLSPSLLSFGKSCFPGRFGLAPAGSADLLVFPECGGFHRGFLPRLGGAFGLPCCSRDVVLGPVHVAHQFIGGAGRVSGPSSAGARSPSRFTCGCSPTFRRWWLI